MAKIVKYAQSGGMWGGGGGRGIGASRAIVWGLCMIDTQLST